jgi:hypothetical protein
MKASSSTCRSPALREISAGQLDDLDRGRVRSEVLARDILVFRQALWPGQSPTGSAITLFGRGRFYIEDCPNVRFHVPYDRARAIKGIDSFKYISKIGPHGPHHDSWYYCPTQCLDVWMRWGRW